MDPRDQPTVGILPQQVRSLHPRMRQIAQLIYLSGGATAKDIQAHIDDPLKRDGIRTLLRRLINRGIIKTRPSGHHREILYLPAIMTKEVRRVALERLITQRFDGSIDASFSHVMRLVARQR